MEKTKNVVEIATETDRFKLIGRPCELSSFSFVPTNRPIPPERTFFNSEKTERYSSSTYDRLFHQDHGYNNKLHRCDREHAKSKGLVVNHEECIKVVPSLASGEYGHRLDHKIDPRDRKHVRINQVQQQFYRRNGINMKPPNSLQDL